MGFPWVHIIIGILWSTISTLSMIQYIHHVKNLKIADKFIFFLIFAIGGPVFGINQILTTLLDCILPEGWDDDDFD